MEIGDSVSLNRSLTRESGRGQKKQTEDNRLSALDRLHDVDGSFSIDAKPSAQVSIAHKTHPKLQVSGVLAPVKDLGIQLLRSGKRAGDVVRPSYAFFIGERPEQPDDGAQTQAGANKPHEALLPVRPESIEGAQAKIRP